MKTAYKVLSFVELLDGVPAPRSLANIYAEANHVAESEIPAEVDFARVFVEGNPVRFRNDGTDPNEITGVLIPPSEDPNRPVVVGRGNFATWKVVQTSLPGTAVLRIEFCQTG
jgi:hypothetical protein